MPTQTDPVYRFRGPYCFLSNFWPSQIELDGVVYPTVEHAYQAAKTRNKRIRELILRCATPGQARRAGRSIPTQSDWDEMKLSIMESLLREKFKNPALMSMLQDTANRILIEGNDWGDKFWGKCAGVGENHLGQLLMHIRDNGQDNESRASSE